MRKRTDSDGFYAYVPDGADRTKLTPMWFMSVGQAEEYVRSAYSRHVIVKHDSAGVALRMTAADPGVYGDHPDYREEWRT